MVAQLLVPGLYTLAVGPVNTFFLDAPEGGILIDTGVPGRADEILAALAQLGKRPSDVRHLLLTHAHPDHIGSLAALQRATGARTYMHALDVPIATSGTGFRPMGPPPGLFYKLLFKLFMAFMKPDARVEPATIDELVSDGQVLPLAGGLRAIHVPGHCAGQLAFLWPQHGGVLFAADACLNTPSLGPSFVYEDVAEGERSLRKLAQLPFEVACFGHGKAIKEGAAARFRKRWPNLSGN